MSESYERVYAVVRKVEITESGTSVWVEEECWVREDPTASDGMADCLPTDEGAYPVALGMPLWVTPALAGTRNVLPGDHCVIATTTVAEFLGRGMPESAPEHMRT